MPHQLSAQHLINGRVTDAASGETLPSANVQIEGTFKGTITNADGQFSLQIDVLPAVLVFRYIGYESQFINVTDQTTQNLIVALKPTIYSLEELIVTEKDPAIDIMRKVIEHKQEWRKQLASYSAEAYNRFTLKNDTGIVSIIESFTDTYWNPVDGTREVVKARRQTSNLDIGEVLPAAQFVANLYDDNIDIAGYNFMGVTHPDALSHYVFELLGYRRIDDQVVFDISVRPRNKLKTGFVGKIAVLDDRYALLEVKLNPGQAFLFPPPIQAFDVTYEQQYSNFGGDFWLPVDFRSNMAVEIGLNRLLSFPTFHIDQVSRISNYKVNAVPPDTLFAKDESVVVDSVAIEEDTLLDQEGIAVPLDKAEATAYETIDSTMTLAKAYEPRGPLAKVINASARNEDTGDEVMLAGGKKQKGLDLDLSPHLRLNRVEGFYGELGVGRSIGKRLKLKGALGFSTALPKSDALSYEVGGSFFLDKGRRYSLSANLANYTDTQTASTPALRMLNGAVVLFEGADYFDYYRNERIKSAVGIRIPDYKSRIELSVRAEKHSMLEKHSDYDLLGGSFIQRENPRIDEGKLNAMGLRLDIGDDDETLGLTGRRHFSLDIEHSTPDFLGSDFSFTSYSMELEWRVNTFFRRRLLPNVLDVKVVTRLSSGTVPLQRMGAIDGRMGIYNRFGTLKTLQNQPIPGEDVIGAFWEHNFKTVPFELLGMRRLAENGINFLVFGGHARSSGNPRSMEDLFNICIEQGEGIGCVKSNPVSHHEIGVSISGLFSLFRVDFATRLDAPGFTVGIGTARIF